MKLQPFQLERWFADYEFQVKYNLCASCAGPTSTGDLLKLAGKDGFDRYTALGLDYIPSEGTMRLREAIAGTYKGLGAQDIRVTTGASEAIFILMNVLFQPGDRILVQAPIYQSLFSVAESIGCVVDFWRGRMENGFLPDLDELEALMDKDTKAVIINSPNSPTGMVFPEGYLKRLIELVEDRGLLLISDEVYRGLVFETSNTGTSPVELSERALSIGDLTKPLGLGGLRVGWIAARNQEILRQCGMFRDYTTMCCAAPSEFLAAVALENRERLLQEKIRTARENIALFTEFAAGYRGLLEWIPPVGGVSAFPRLKLEVTGRDFCSRLVSEKSVLLLPGDVFGLKSHFRIGFGAKPEVFREGLQKFGEYLDTVKTV